MSLDTTNIYAEVDLATKAKALSECSIPDGRTGIGASSQNSWPSCAHCEVPTRSAELPKAGEIMLRPWTVTLGSGSV